MATKDNSVSERIMAEASGENPFTPCELLQEIEPLLHTYFLGNFGWNGGALHRNPYPVVVPCHRVVNREGRLAPAFAFGGWEKQAELLRAEGVETDNGYVDICKYVWNGEE